MNFFKGNFLCHVWGKCILLANQSMSSPRWILVSRYKEMSNWWALDYLVQTVELIFFLHLNQHATVAKKYLLNYIHPYKDEIWSIPLELIVWTLTCYSCERATFWFYFFVTLFLFLMDEKYERKLLYLLPSFVHGSHFTRESLYKKS